MGTIARITKWLQRRPELVYRVSGRTITLQPPLPAGFPVSLTEGAAEWVVGFGSWHERFRSEDEALKCFMFGLSDRCRLRVHYRGSFPYRWAVEERIGADWREDSTTGLLLFPFWRRARVEYRQNAVLCTTEGDAPADLTGL